jgi:nucleotide-binding universal stress UspA family protein
MRQQSLVVRFFHGSISRAVLRHAPMSVACVPALAAARIEGPHIRECRRVLVAVDLNEPYGFAAAHGYSIVQSGGAVRLLYNAVPRRPPNALTRGTLNEDSANNEHAQYIAESEAKLRALAPSEALARNIVTDVEVTESLEADEAICVAAERFGADVICIGSHTLPGFTAKVLGSVALRVLQGSRRSALWSGRRRCNGHMTDLSHVRRSVIALALVLVLAACNLTDVQGMVQHR